MIKLNSLIPVAEVNKTHGIHGELSVTVDQDITLEPGSCLITPVDGIPVPFFIASIRPKTTDTYLISLDGVDTDSAASEFVGVTFYVDPSALSDGDDDSDTEDEAEGFYASMLIGATLADTDGTTVGTIADIDDSTQNILLIVERDDKTHVMVPLATDLITDYDSDKAVLTMDIPAGLLDMQ